MFYHELTNQTKEKIKEKSIEELLEIKTECLRLLEYEPYDIITIHDATRCLANHTGSTKQAYNQALADINTSELLSDLLTQINGSEVDTDAGMLSSKDILQSKYALC